MKRTQWQRQAQPLNEDARGRGRGRGHHHPKIQQRRLFALCYVALLPQYGERGTNYSLLEHGIAWRLGCSEGRGLMYLATYVGTNRSRRNPQMRFPTIAVSSKCLLCRPSVISLTCTLCWDKGTTMLCPHNHDDDNATTRLTGALSGQSSAQHKARRSKALSHRYVFPLDALTMSILSR